MSLPLPPFLVKYVEGTDEDDRVELKSSIDLNDSNNERKNKFAKSVCALANSSDSDAFIIIGVKDPKRNNPADDAVIGVNIPDKEAFKQQIIDVIRNHCISGPGVNTSFYAYKEKVLVVIRIRSFGVKPFRRIIDPDKVWIRVSDQTRIANPDEIIRMVEKRIALKANYDAVKQVFYRVNNYPADKKIDDQEIQWLINMAKDYIDEYGKSFDEGYNLLSDMYYYMDKVDPALEYLEHAIQISAKSRYRMRKISIFFGKLEIIAQEAKDASLGSPESYIPQIQECIQQIEDEIITIEGFEGDSPDVRSAKRKLELYKKELQSLKQQQELKDG